MHTLRLGHRRGVGPRLSADGYRVVVADLDGTAAGRIGAGLPGDTAAAGGDRAWDPTHSFARNQNIPPAGQTPPVLAT